MDNNNLENNTTTVNDSIFPPLPGSDPESIARNKFDGFYGVGARDYWKHAEISLNKVKDFDQCLHFFIQEGAFTRCTKCSAGFIGAGISVQDGKLLINNQAVL